MATAGHFGCPKITFDSISGHFILIRNFFFDILDGTTMSIIELVRDICMLCQVWRMSFKSFKSYRTDNEIVTQQWPRCWRKHNIPENLCFSGI